MFLLRRRFLLSVLVLVAVVAFIGDRAAKGYAEDAIETSIRQQIQGVSEVEASIGSFPFVGRLLVQGKVSRFELTLHEVLGYRLPVEELRLSVDGLELDRGSLRDRNDVEITGVDSVRVDLLVTRENVEAVLGPLTDVAFSLADGTTLRVEDGDVVLGAGIRFPLPGSELLPCAATATVDDGHVRIVCTSDHLPQVVLDAVGSLELRNR